MVAASFDILLGQAKTRQQHARPENRQDRSTEFLHLNIAPLK
jgi:hypothetical protein